MKVLVFGSRTMRDRAPIEAAITGLYHTRPGTEGFTIIHGGARGADSIAGEVAKDLARQWEWVQTRAYAADWRTHHPDWCPGAKCRGRGPTQITWDRCIAAGPRRNQEMLDKEHTEDEPVTLGLGFVDKKLSSSRGSDDMASRLRKARVPVWVLWVPRTISDDRVQSWPEPPPGKTRP